MEKEIIQSIEIEKPKKKRKLLISFIVFLVLISGVLGYLYIQYSDEKIMENYEPEEFFIKDVSGELESVGNLEQAKAKIENRQGASNPAFGFKNTSDPSTFLYYFDHDGKLLISNLSASGNIATSGNITSDYGFFSYLGGIPNKITTGIFTNLFADYINSTNVTTVYYGNGSDWYTIEQLLNDTDIDTTIGNCSGDQACDNVLYETDYPMENKTISYCGNITGSVADLCTITSGGNLSFNQTLTDTLYAGIEWDYNQSLATFTMWNATWSTDTDTNTQKTTNDFYLYNDSTTIYFNDTQLNTTIDARGIGDNASWNQTLAELLFAGIEWDYNQSLATFNMWNTTWATDTGTTNHSLLTDLLVDVHTQYLAVNGTRASSGQQQFDAGAIIDDNQDLIFGSGGQGRIRWRLSTNDWLEIQTGVNAASSTGVVTLIEIGDAGSANREPGLVLNPTLMGYSSDGNEADDRWWITHDQTNAVIGWGNGDLQLNGSVNVEKNITVKERICFTATCSHFLNDTGEYWNNGSTYIIANSTGIYIQA